MRERETKCRKMNEKERRICEKEKMREREAKCKKMNKKDRSKWIKERKT